jgi:hypothetical protein
MSSSVKRFPPYVDLTTRVGGVGDLAGGANGLTAILAFEVAFCCELAAGNHPHLRKLTRVLVLPRRRFSVSGCSGPGTRN